MTTIGQLRAIIKSSLESLYVKKCELQARYDYNFKNCNASAGDFLKRLIYVQGKIDTLEILLETLKTK